MIVLTLLCALIVSAQTALDVSPHVGLIEVFGNRRVSLAKVRAALVVKEGEPLPSAESAQDRINRLSGIAASRLEAACCTADGSMILYVGVEERDTSHLELHPLPTGDARLPSDLYDDYLNFLAAVEGSIKGRNADEDLTNGYSLLADPYARFIQQGFVSSADKNLTLLDQVLHESSDPEQRACAAYLLAYGPRGRKSKVVTDALQYALRDQEDIVRKNALRSIRAVYVGARLHPEQDVAIEPAWLVATLNSVVWSDRVAAAQILVDLTDDRKSGTLDQIRERALPAVVEMARWQTLNHALPAFILAGRLSGLDDKAIKDAWSREDRESVLGELSPKKGRKGK